MKNTKRKQVPAKSELYVRIRGGAVLVVRK